MRFASEDRLEGGEGVGVVTKPGLGVPVGEPAINPVPRRMIWEAVREVTERPLAVTIAIPGGEELVAGEGLDAAGVEGGVETCHNAGSCAGGLIS